MATAQRHEELSDQFLEQAEIEYMNGDVLQASEKAWGAVAHCINAIARDRGWKVGSHRALIENAERLIRSDSANAEQASLQRLRSVNALHANFYEDWLPPGVVEGGIADAKELVLTLWSLHGRRD